ncbi:hypothetical protein [Methanoregula sp.]|uniref:hypothetical protein n=1 Tax=Methanoregula sp. TaxID=2052170 RepID=UPI003565728B
MKRITINAIIDIGCLIAFIPSLFTGGLVLFPPLRWGKRRQLGYVDGNNPA